MLVALIVFNHLEWTTRRTARKKGGVYRAFRGV